MSTETETYSLGTDFYATLGIPSTASAEEIKNAHVALALKHHPDMSAENDGGKRFRAISEAWAVLGKPEKRQSYDLARIRVLGSKGAYAGSAGPIESEISDGFQTQKANFNVAVQAKASSNWRELQDKYKKESWQRMPLSERKLTRVRGLQTIGGTLMPVVLMVGFVAVAGYGYYSATLGTRPRRTASAAGR